MAYSSPSDVASVAAHLANSGCDFTASTNPTFTQVAAYLSTGCAIIEARIGTRGYGAIPTDSPAYGLATAANTFYGAWQSELSRISAAVNRMENTRDDRFKRAFESMLDMLTGMDLSVMGVSRSRSYSPPYMGGLRQTDKDENDDGDIVQSRFLRGQFSSPEAGEPSVKGSSGS